MSKIKIPAGVTRAVGKVAFAAKKHAPEILTIAGVVGGVVSTVMACDATLKLEETLAETKENAAKVRDILGDNGITEEQYSEADGRRDLAIIYTRAGVKLLKLYGPSLIVGGLSITSIFSSHKIMKKRNIALAAAYSALDKGFKDYRGRVVERFGEEVDRQLKYNLKAVEVEETVTDEKGKEKKVKKTVEIPVGSIDSPYAVIFDEHNPYWEKDPELNKFFIQSRMAQANDKLRANGYLYLNEVLEMLGFDRTKAGQVVGWVYDKDNPDIDSRVDFGIYDIYNVSPEEAERKVAFINGYERSIILDFNVDGNIWEKF